MMISYKKFIFYIPATFWLSIITIISAYPGNKIPEIPIWQIDKLIHTGIYLVLSVFLLFAFQEQYNQPKNRFKTCVIILFFGIFYGGFMEILQHYIFINRSGNWYDVIANTFGAILGVLIYPYIIKLLPINK